MNKVFKIKLLFTLLFTILILKSSYAQLIANAGSGKIICPGVTFSLGGTPAASGGTPPYTYSWVPETFLVGTSSPNPSCAPKEDIYYTLTVTDATGAVSVSNVQVSMAYVQYVDAGADISMCVNDSVMLGVDANVLMENLTYSWSPLESFADSSAFSPRPMVKPMETTTYELTASFTGCDPKKDVVTVTVIQPPPINAGLDTTIQEGTRAILHGSGGFFYQWGPEALINTLKYPTTSHPDAEPVTTAEYVLTGRDKTGKCKATDTVIVTVTPFEELVLYNTFTPNSDGNNDNWYIGNIEKYPNSKVEIYNRYGKLVYKTTGYENAWDGNTFDGKSFGENLPAATYFYNIDLGVAGKKYHGTLSIVR